MTEECKPDATDSAKLQAVAQIESVCAMVAALECDYGRFEEMRQKIKIPYVEFGSFSLEKDYFAKGVEA